MKYDRGSGAGPVLSKGVDGRRIEIVIYTLGVRRRIAAITCCFIRVPEEKKKKTHTHTRFLRSASNRDLHSGLMFSEIIRPITIFLRPKISRNTHTHTLFFGLGVNKEKTMPTVSFTNLRHVYDNDRINNITLKLLETSICVSCRSSPDFIQLLGY